MDAFPVQHWFHETRSLAKTGLGQTYERMNIQMRSLELTRGDHAVLYCTQGCVFTSLRTDEGAENACFEPRLNCQTIVYQDRLGTSTRMVLREKVRKGRFLQVWQSTPEPGDGPIYSVAFSPDATMLAAAGSTDAYKQSGYGRVSIWDATQTVSRKRS